MWFWFWFSNHHFQNDFDFDFKSPLFRWFDFDFKIINIWWFCPSLPIGKLCQMQSHQTFSVDCWEYWCSSHATPKHIVYNCSLRKKNQKCPMNLFFQISIIWPTKIQIRCPIPMAITGKPWISLDKQNFL